MTPLPTQLREAAAGSRELDALVCVAFSYRADLPKDPHGRPAEQCDGFLLHPGVMIPPRVTQSVDAALALIEEVLPGWKMSVRQTSKGYFVFFQGDENWKDADGFHAEFAIAIILAGLDGLALLSAVEGGSDA